MCVFIINFKYSIVFFQDQVNRPNINSYTIEIWKNGKFPQILFYIHKVILPMQSMHITTKVVSSNPVHGEV